MPSEKARRALRRLGFNLTNLAWIATLVLVILVCLARIVSLARGWALASGRTP